VSGKEVGELADTLKELRLFMQKTVNHPWKQPAGKVGTETAAKAPGFAP
jgi:hypothetical protein